jgi:hypothetical protein
MKKYLMLIVMLFSFIAMEAQVATSIVTAPATAVSLTSPTATASIYKITNATAGYWLVKAPLEKGSKQDWAIKLDSVSGNHTNVAVAVWGQKSSLKGDWTAIGSAVNWKGTTADTVIIISNASFVYYQNFKVVYTGTGTGVTKLTQQNLKLWTE